ncbi:hypothetical protein I317_02943 [Kwoniella heveanensis CBS 569]|nr:hypothetical protein I317_02943 [Kwoniella heveanensis CBS 569]
MECPGCQTPHALWTKEISSSDHLCADCLKKAQCPSCRSLRPNDPVTASSKRSVAGAATTVQDHPRTAVYVLDKGFPLLKRCYLDEFGENELL